MKNNIKLSIITINYNNRDGLRKTIESVVSQTYRDFEYVVIDGGSTDGSVEVIKEYAGRIDYWVSERDKGIYNAMNKGAFAAHGEYLQFLFVYYILFGLLKRLPANDWVLCVASCAALFVIPGCSSLQVNLLFPYFWGVSFTEI